MAWSGGRRDVHLLLELDGRLVSHVGLLQHEVHVGGQIVRLAGLGGVITVPEAQGHGYASQLIQYATRLAFEEWSASAGLLFCLPRMVPYYERIGWRAIEQPVRSINPLAAFKRRSRRWFIRLRERRCARRHLCSRVGLGSSPRSQVKGRQGEAEENAMTIRIEPMAASPDADAALEALLHESYVGGGFTEPDLADTMLRAEAVRSRGVVLVAHDAAGVMLGTVTLVSFDSPARRLAAPDEAELHLLCVRPDMRRHGVGRALVQEALTRMQANGARGVVLWTQPTMDAAQRLYEQCGFRRDPAADFTRGARQFLVYRRAFQGEE